MSERAPWWQRTRPLLPGLAVALAVAIVGVVVHRRVSVVSPHVIAVGFGILGATFGRIDAALVPGLRCAAKKVLRAGIVVLGFRLSFSEIRTLGLPALAAVLVVVVATFFGTQWMARRFGLPASLGLLMATGYSICGASAIAAVEPFADANDEEIAYSIALVTLCGTLAIVVLPTLGTLLHLSATQFGAWVGASVHDVGQVVAAASTHGDVALRKATVVKLTRVAMLAPLLAGVAVSARRRLGSEVLSTAKRPPVVPLFIVLFLVAVGIRSTGVVPAHWLANIKDLETVLLGMGLVGLGSNVNLRAFRAVGGKPLMLGLCSWALVAVVSLAAVTLSGL
jgi:uncharacterized integral membrane protein (TIGR00698 family)